MIRMVRVVGYLDDGRPVSGRMPCCHSCPASSRWLPASRRSARGAVTWGRGSAWAASWPHTAACDPGLHIGQPVQVAPNRAREFHRVQVPISYPGASGGLAHAQHLGQLLFVDQKPLVGWNGGCLAGMVGQCYGHADASYQVSLSAAPVSGKDSWAAIAFVELATLLYGPILGTEQTPAGENHEGHVSPDWEIW